MTSVVKTASIGSIDLSFLVDGQGADAGDVTVPFTSVATLLDAYRQYLSVSATDLNMKNLQDALVAGVGITLTLTNGGGDEKITITGGLVQGASGDATPNTLDQKLVAGAGITLSVIGTTNKQVQISQNGKVAVSITDTTPDYLVNKILALTNKTKVTKFNAGGNENLKIDLDATGQAANLVPVTNGSNDWAWAAAGVGGASPTDITVTAGENLSLRDLVYVDITAQKAFKLDADAVGAVKVGAVRGIVQSGAISTNATGTVRVLGIISGYTGLTPFADVWASTTAGSYTQVKPTVTAGGGQVAFIRIGYAVNTTDIFVLPTTAQFVRRESLAPDTSMTIEHYADLSGHVRAFEAYIGSDSPSATPHQASFTGRNGSGNTIDFLLKANEGAGALVTVDSAGTTVRSIGNVAGALSGVAQTWTPSTTGQLANFAVQFAGNSGSPTGGIIAGLYLDNAGVPGTLLGTITLASITASASNTWFGGQMVPTTTAITFGAGLTLTADMMFIAGVTYWITLLPVNQSLASNVFYQADSSATSVYAGGQIWTSSNNGSTWTGISTSDLRVAITISSNLGNNGNAIAQSFTTTDAIVVDSIGIGIFQWGNPTGTLTIRVETDNSGVPSGTLAHPNATATLAESSVGLTAAYTTISYSDFPLQANTTYWITLTTTRSAGDGSYIGWMGSTGNPYTTGGPAIKFNVSSVWSTASGNAQPANDRMFVVNAVSTSYEEPLVCGRFTGGTRDVGIRFDDGDGANGDIKTTFYNELAITADIVGVVKVV